MAAGLDLVASYPVKFLSVRHTSLILKNGSSLQLHSLLGPTGSIYQYVTSVKHFTAALLSVRLQSVKRRQGTAAN